MRLKPDTINGLANGVYSALAMLAAMQLDVFTPLGQGPKTAEDIAAALGLDTTKLSPLLYALVTTGLLAMDGERFANSAESDHFLVSGKRSYIGGLHEAYSDLWSAALRTAESIRTGVPQAMHDFSAMAEEELRAFLRGLDPGAVAAAKSLARHFDFAGYATLIDLAAGSGGLAMELCRRFPGLVATAVDLPNVAAITKGFVAEAGLEDRIVVQACDVVAAAPAGVFDVAVLRSFLQVIPPDAARLAVIHTGEALRPGGDIYIVGRVLDDTRLGPPETVAFNVVFLSVYDGGQAHTEGRHRQWLKEAGFIDITRKQLAGGYSVIQARKRPIGRRAGAGVPSPERGFT